MPGKRPKPEEIVSKLRQVELFQSQGKIATEAIRSIGVGGPFELFGVRVTLMGD